MQAGTSWNKRIPDKPCYLIKAHNFMYSILRAREFRLKENLSSDKKMETYIVGAHTFLAQSTQRYFRVLKLKSLCCCFSWLFLTTLFLFLAHLTGPCLHWADYQSIPILLPGHLWHVPTRSHLPHPADRSSWVQLLCRTCFAVWFSIF